jgi:hypothetical protein
MNRYLWSVTACATVLILFPASSGAQAPATSFDGLRLVVQDGSEVVLTNSDGRRIRGKLVSVTTSSLALVVERPRFLILRERLHQSFTEAAVTTVTRIDSRWEGAIIGFLAGFVPVVLPPCPSNDVDGCGLVKVVLGPLAGALGAAIGVAIDGSINTIVYRNGNPSVGGATITLSPLINTKTAGASLRLRF